LEVIAEAIRICQGSSEVYALSPRQFSQLLWYWHCLMANMTILFATKGILWDLVDE